MKGENVTTLVTETFDCILDKIAERIRTQQRAHDAAASWTSETLVFVARIRSEYSAVVKAKEQVLAALAPPITVRMAEMDTREVWSSWGDR